MRSGGTKPLPPLEDRRPERVRSMFGAIARRYDLLNHLLSLGLDPGWRRRAARELPDDPDAVVLDLCGGTGDFGLEIVRSRRGGLAVCLDFAHPMLLRASAKFARSARGRRCVPVEGDGLRLPFRDGCFDGAVVAFGVRNLADMGAGFREVLRVLRPGGRFVVLEFSAPRRPIVARLHGLYLRHVVPRVGDRLAGAEGPYGYLARTIGEFPDPPLLAGALREAGFAACGWTLLCGGIVCVHTAIAAGTAAGGPAHFGERPGPPREDRDGRLRRRP